MPADARARARVCMNALAYALAYALAPRVGPAAGRARAPAAATTRRDRSAGALRRAPAPRKGPSPAPRTRRGAPRSLVHRQGRLGGGSGRLKGPRACLRCLRCRRSSRVRAPSAKALAPRARVHRERADALGVQSSAEPSRRASPRAAARGRLARSMRAHAVSRRDAGDSVGNSSRSPSQSGRGPRHLAAARAAPPPSRRRRRAGETERRERQDRLGVDGTGARLEQTGATRACRDAKPMRAASSPSHAGTARARRARRVHPAPRRGGAALHLHRVRRGFGRGRGVEKGVVVCGSGVVEESNRGSREARQRGAVGEKAKVAATRREPKRSCSIFNKNPGFPRRRGTDRFRAPPMLRVVRRNAPGMKPRAGLSPSRLAAAGLRSASIWRTRKSRSRLVGRRKSQRPVEVARGAGRLLRTRRTLSNIFS